MHDANDAYVFGNNISERMITMHVANLLSYCIDQPDYLIF
jgi:hypothetical protein